MTSPERRQRSSPYNSSLVLAAIACLLYFVGRAPFPGQWDSFDYLKQIVTHRLSDLGFGRPFFIGYNIVLWETTRKIFRLDPLYAEDVVRGGIILLGGLGVLFFRNLTSRVLPPGTAAIGVLAFILSPLYALYSGYVMTEVPMLALVLAAAWVLWESDCRVAARDISGGILYGVALGIREQAVTLACAYLWIVWVRRPTGRWRSSLRFFLSALLVALAPLLAIYLYDRGAYLQRVENWIRIIPKEEAHIWKNIQASLIWVFVLCPATWLATLGAAVYRYRARLRFFMEGSEGARLDSGIRLGPGAGAKTRSLGLVCSLILPIVVLWRDADVQIHPRYALIALPASLIVCSSLYRNWLPSPRAAVIWGLLHLMVFGLAQAVIQPFRELQRERKEYALHVKQNVQNGLLIAGAYSPTFDYYRAIGERPQWRILWSGWDWSRARAAAAVEEAWMQGRPVYLCDGPGAWLFFEDERLDLHSLLYGRESEVVAPRLVRVYPWPPVSRPR